MLVGTFCNLLVSNRWRAIFLYGYSVNKLIIIIIIISIIIIIIIIIIITITTIISIGNHTVFLVQFGINLHDWVFQKAEIAPAASQSGSGYI